MHLFTSNKKAFVAGICLCLIFFLSTGAKVYKQYITDHVDLDSIGTNTHAELDTHEALTINAHGLTYTAEGSGGGLDADLLDGEEASAFAVSAEGVHNGDSHDHVDGDGAQINHTGLSNIGTDSHTTIDSHLDSTSDPHSVTKAQVGLPSVLDILHKIDATQAPTVNDDVDEGYSAGSTWTDVTNNKSYVCVDASDGVADWDETTAGAGSGDMTKAVYDTDTNNIVDKAEAIPHVTSGGVTVAEGQIIQKSHEDALAVNGGGTGEVQDKALLSFLDQWSFNLVSPKALFDIDTKWLITAFGPKLPNGMVIVKMICSCDADPTTEIVADFMYATGGDFIGLTGATVIIAIDSTAGEFSEDTNANFNGGSPIPAGAVVYVLLKAAPDVDTTQYGCTVTSYNPED